MTRIGRTAAAAAKIALAAVLIASLWTGTGTGLRKAEAHVAIAGDGGSWSFESDAPNQVPVGWTTSANGSALVASDPLDAANRAMKLDKLPTAGAFTAVAVLDVNLKAITVKARVLPSQIAGTNAALYAPYLKDASGATFISLNWYPDGRVAINHSGSVENLATVDVQQWQEIAVTADFEAASFAVYVNGQQVKSGAPFRTNAEEAAQLLFGMSGSLSGAAYVDDVEVYGFDLYDTAISDRFDSSPLDQTPAGWSANAYGSALVRQDGAGLRSLRLEASAPTSSYLATRSFPEERGELIVHARLKPGAWTGAGGAFYGPYLKDGTGTTFASVNWTTAGTIAINHGSSVETVATYSAAEWYDVDVVLDTEARVFDLYVNGALLRSGTPFRAPVNALGSIVFGSYTGTSGAADVAEVTVVRKRPYRAEVTGVELDRTSLTLNALGRTSLTAEVLPGDAINRKLIWSSSDPAVVDVRPAAEGATAELHAGPSPGTATVTVTTVEGSFQASAAVTVQARPVQASFYVSPGGDDQNPGTEALPFRTLERARDAVRGINADMTGDIAVWLRGGTYQLAETLKLDERDGGTNGFDVAYRAYPGETPVVSGGRFIEGWTLHNAGMNIYKAEAGDDLETRQLYVNGERAVRARSESGLPGHVLYRTTSATHPYRDPSGLVKLGHKTTWTDMATWGNPQDIELVYKAIWTNPRVGVQSITIGGDGLAAIEMKQPGYFYATNKGATSAQTPWYVENAYELLDEEGEWYLDRTTDTFYYKPRAGEDMSSAEVVAPVLETLLQLEGAGLDEPVEHIRFEGLHFRHATWLRPNTSSGHSDAQNNVIRERFTVGGSPSFDDYPKYPEWIDGQAAVVLRTAARHIEFERNVFSQLGHIGILMLRGSQHNLVRGNTFVDISAQGVQIGGDDYDRGVPDLFYPDDERKLLRNNDVLHNYFEQVAVEYRSAAAIGASYPVDTNIENNTMVDLPYSGIHAGWGWSYIGGPNQGQTGSVPSADPPPTGGNSIRFNRIENVMQELVDGGAIYTLGRQSSTSYITDNYIYGQRNEYGAIYPDEGSNLYAIRDNVIEDSVRWLHIHTGSIQDNRITGNFTDTGRITFNGTNNELSGNTVVTGGNWPQRAIGIREASGVGPGYADIVP